MKIRKRGLLVRVTAVSLLLGAAAMLASGFALYSIFRARAVENLKNSLSEQSSVMAYQLVRYRSIAWLLPYWQQHHEEMTLPPPSDADAYSKWYDARAEFEALNAAALTVEDILEMSGEKQLLFAEYCYHAIFFEIELERMRGNTDVVSCFLPDWSGEGAFAFFRGAADDALWPQQHPVLGEMWEFRPEDHPLVMALHETELPLDSGIEYYRSPEDGIEYASTYALIGRDRQFVGVLSVSRSLQRMTEEIRSDVCSFEKWVALIILAAILTMYAALYRLSLKPMLRLARNIRLYTRDKSAEQLSESLEVLIRREDEIGALAGDVREMVEQNELSVRQRVENEALKTKLLLAQIKPHFIYNSLCVIRSYMDEPQKAEDALNHFAGFLRGSMDMLEETDCVRAEREFKAVDDYLYIQKARFGDHLRVVTEYGDTDFLLPPFSVQTLVENAIEHGIRAGKDGCGTVWIRSYEADGFHVVEVEDNGAGMPPEGLAAAPEEHLHIGLQNVQRRLELLCRGTLAFRSEAGKGSAAVIRIPKLSGEARSPDIADTAW